MNNSIKRHPHPLYDRNSTTNKPFSSQFGHFYNMQKAVPTENHYLNAFQKHAFLGFTTVVSQTLVFATQKVTDIIHLFLISTRSSISFSLILDFNGWRKLDNNRKHDKNRIGLVKQTDRR